MAKKKKSWFGWFKKTGTWHAKGFCPSGKKHAKKRSLKGLGVVEPVTLGIGAVVALGLAVLAKRKKVADAAAAAQAAAEAAGLSPEEAEVMAAQAAASAAGGGSGSGAGYHAGDYVDPYGGQLPWTERAYGSEATSTGTMNTTPTELYEAPAEEVTTTTTAPPPATDQGGGFVPPSRGGGRFTSPLRTTAATVATSTSRTPTGPARFTIPAAVPQRPVIRPTIPVRITPAIIRAPIIRPPMVVTTALVPGVTASTFRAPMVALRPMVAIRPAMLRGLAFTIDEASPLPPWTDMGFGVSADGSLRAKPTQVIEDAPFFRSPRRPTLVRRVPSPVISTTSRTTQVLNQSVTSGLRTLRALRGFSGIAACNVEEV